MSLGQVELDPRFCNAPRVAMAGGDAASLYLMCVAHANHKRTGPYVAADIVGALVGRRKLRLEQAIRYGLLCQVDENTYELDTEYVRFHFTPAYRHRRGVTDADRAIVYERDGHACRACGATENLSVDHIDPVAKGGAHHIDNFQTLCRPCNIKKGVQPWREFAP